MIHWIIIGVYVLGYLYCWRSVVWTILDVNSYGDADSADITFAVVMGSFACVAWPLFAVYRIVSRLITAKDVETVLMPRHVRKQIELKQMRKAAVEREYRIKQLERDLGIKQTAPSIDANRRRSESYFDFFDENRE